MRAPLRALGFAFLLTLLGTASHAQTTGEIVGKVEDESGGVLPGTAISAQGPALQGTRSTVTDAGGGYRLTLLPPGAYTLTFSLSGFATETRQARVALAQTSIVEQRLRAAVSREITVTEAPIDTTSHALGTNLTQSAIENLPTGRTYSSIIRVMPGTSSDANPENTQQSSITIHGSAGNENTFLIDGVNTTNLEYGFAGKDLNYEFIQELDVKTGGYEAEYGRSTGGIINVITKSGGNQFHGDFFAYHDADSLQADAKGIISASTVAGFTRSDFGFDLGGPLVKDKLWFFAAYDRVNHSTESILPEGPRAGAVATTDSHRDLGSMKLTWNFAKDQSLIGSYFQDPRTDSGAINDANHSLNGDPLTYDGRFELGGRDIAARYQGILAGKWVVTAQLARHNEKNSLLPASSAGDIIQFRDSEDNFFQTGGFGLIQDKTFHRTSVGGAVTRFAGGHKLKFGVEYEDQDAEVVKRMSGGQQVDVLVNPVDPSRPIYRHAYWTTADATVDDAPADALRASPAHHNTTLFAQDSWTVNDRLTVNVGLRWDRQQIIDAAGTQQIDLNKDFAPRLGVVVDPRGDHKTKVFGSFGHYYEQLPMDLVIRSFSFERQPRIINYDPESLRPDARAEADLKTESAILGGFTEPSDPDIRGQYIREFIVGAEHEVATDFTLGVKGIFRDYGRVIEDFLCMDDGTYCIGNPGKGIMREVFTLDYARTLPAPRPERDYKALQVDVTKRLSNQWQGLASYVYSRLEGNYDGEYAPFTNVGADPNISAAYDYYDFFTDGTDLSRITNAGPLSNDRRHQLKVSGVYETPFQLSVGMSAYWRSGTPLTRYGYSDAYGRYEFFLGKRAEEGRVPASYEADLHLAYPLRLGEATANLLLDVFSLLNAQRPVLLDQRWGFQEADNASPTPVNPGYGRPVLRTPPITARFGVRLSF